MWRSSCRVGETERRPVTDGGREVRPALCFDVKTRRSLLKAGVTVGLYFYIYITLTSSCCVLFFKLGQSHRLDKNFLLVLPLQQKVLLVLLDSWKPPKSIFVVEPFCHYFSPNAHRRSDYTYSIYSRRSWKQEQNRGTWGEHKSLTEVLEVLEQKCVQWNLKKLHHGIVFYPSGLRCRVWKELLVNQFNKYNMTGTFLTSKRDDGGSWTLKRLNFTWEKPREPREGPPTSCGRDLEEEAASYKWNVGVFADVQSPGGFRLLRTLVFSPCRRNWIFSYRGSIKVHLILSPTTCGGRGFKATAHPKI